jgi:excisionase family DNA binding protein
MNSSSRQPPNSDHGRFLTVKQLAARWQISTRQVHRIIADGGLKVHRFGRSVRIAIEDIELFEFRNRGRDVSSRDTP